MTVTKRWNKDKSNFCWQFCITIQKKPRKQYRKSGFKTKTEAVNAENQAIAKFVNGDILRHENKTFYDIGKLFLKGSQSKAKNTIRNYKNSFENHLRYFYDLKFKEITPLVVEEWILECGLTPNQIQECVKFGKAAFNNAIRLDLTNNNPFYRVNTPKVKKEKHVRLSLDEAITLLRTCREMFPEDFRTFTIIAVSLFTAIRPAELFALKWSDIDEKTRTILIQRQYTNFELKEELKTSSSYRTVDLCLTLLRILREHKKYSKILSEFIFVNGSGNLINSRNFINRRFKPVLEKVFGDRNYMRFYDLRGTYADILLEKRVPVKYLQTQLGHADYKTTMNAYCEGLPSISEQAVNILEESISILAI